MRAERANQRQHNAHAAGVCLGLACKSGGVDGRQTPLAFIEDGDESSSLLGFSHYEHLTQNPLGANEHVYYTGFRWFGLPPDSVQVCVLNSSGKVLVNRSVPNDGGLIKSLSSRHGVPQRIAIEACCGAADLAEELATQWRLPVQLAHPGYVNRMKQSPDKTDFGDARLLADLARVDYLPAVSLAPRATRELRRLMRHRAQLVRRRKDTKLRIRGLLRENRLKCPSANASTKVLVQLAHRACRVEPVRSLVSGGPSTGTDFAGRPDCGCGGQDSLTDQGRSDCEPVAGPCRRRISHRGHATSGDRACGPFSFGKTVGSLLRRDTAECQQRCARQADAGLIKAGNPEVRQVLIELAHRLAQVPGHWSCLAQTCYPEANQKMQSWPPSPIAGCVGCTTSYGTPRTNLCSRPQLRLDKRGPPPFPSSPSHRPHTRAKADAMAKTEGGSRNSRLEICRSNGIPEERRARVRPGLSRSFADGAAFPIFRKHPHGLSHTGRCSDRGMEITDAKMEHPDGMQHHPLTPGLLS